MNQKIHLQEVEVAMRITTLGLTAAADKEEELWAACRMRLPIRVA